MYTSTIRVLAYPWFYFSIVRSTRKHPNLKPITCIRHPQGLSGNVMQTIYLASKNSGASFNIKMMIHRSANHAYNVYMIYINYNANKMDGLCNLKAREL
jgi:hypothetical protein